MNFDFSQYAGLGIVFAVVWVVVSILFFLLWIWILYTVIWHAVRRGMREFHGNQPPPQ
ncbi:MAG: hypothetical protein IT191_05580 [Microbacteriaceae bacterium]|nr:hypothetical protein [Cryobacterium sp.]MCC6376471.1 hypothetical protein [Microbacteriaceae bacterium]